MKAMVGWISMVALLSGCAARIRADREYQVRATSSKALQCPVEDVEVLETSSWWGGRGRGCGKEARSDTQGGIWVCEASKPFADLARASLAQETACPAEQIRNGPPLRERDYSVYKMVACEKAYVCRVSFSETRCQLALDPTALELPPDVPATQTKSKNAPPWLADCPAKDGESARARALRCREAARTL